MKRKSGLSERQNPSINNSKKRIQFIISWLGKVKRSNLSVLQFFKKYDVPFNRIQYYRYKNKFEESGSDGLEDKRNKGVNKKLNAESEAFIAGCVKVNPNVSLKWLQKELINKFNCELSPSGITKAIQRIFPNKEKRSRGRPVKLKREIQISQCCGFELIIALAYHLGWVDVTAGVISDTIDRLKEKKEYEFNKKYTDKQGRDNKGRFTYAYNQRKEVRENRFLSVTQKRLKKNWQSMNIVYEKRKAIERKSLALLSLPIVTMNGDIRTVNTALGQSLKHFSCYDFKQGTLTKYMNELKYIGVSTKLLEEMIKFWQKCWGTEEFGNEKLLCYYIDGNTKAVWSKKPDKKNKVTMIGRVMGCLESVFIHDCFGHPMYFETYSGHAPCGEYTLELFDKIEKVIGKLPGVRRSVRRVLVMDGASNSVKTLRAFASQKKYHYITPPDNNGWNERKVTKAGETSRYKHGDATLQEVEIELEDSQESGYIVRVKAIKIDWDNGKCTVLLSSLPVKIVGLSEVVRSYFNRWPDEELQFRYMKGSVALSRVAGYGKQQVKNEKTIERQEHASKRIFELQDSLRQPLKEIAEHEHTIAELMPKERELRNQSRIKNGKHVLPAKKMKKLESYQKEILMHETAVKSIEKDYSKKIKLLRKHQRQWLRLQGKETEYKVDVELDQILTFHRACLANLYAYFIKHFLNGESMSFKYLFHKIINLQGRIEETNDIRRIILDYNNKDKIIMNRLSHAIDKINALKIKGPQNKQMVFLLSNCI